ncbi:MAG: hypothetical protein JWQ09_3229 [Segetibacter sp.]|nr:hypothetical protein [Segetibacter sp.]
MRCTLTKEWELVCFNIMGTLKTGKVIVITSKILAMKNNNSKILISAYLIAGCLLLAVQGNSQTRKLPDGSIVYSDGTRRLPNGTVIYKGGNVGNNNNNGGSITLPDGSVVYPDGSRRYPNGGKRNDGRMNRRNNGEWLPPGQAKKIYGGSAKDYAPGQQKKWKEHGHGKGKGKGHKD